MRRSVPLLAGCLLALATQAQAAQRLGWDYWPGTRAAGFNWYRDDSCSQRWVFKAYVLVPEVCGPNADGSKLLCLVTDAKAEPGHTYCWRLTAVAGDTKEESGAVTTGPHTVKAPFPGPVNFGPRE